MILESLVAELGWKITGQQDLRKFQTDIKTTRSAVVSFLDGIKAVARHGHEFGAGIRDGARVAVRELQAVDRQTQKTRQNVAGLGTVLARSLVAGAGAALGVAGAVAVGKGVSELTKGSIQAGAEFRKLGATLETIEGSSEKARASLDWVSKFAEETPFELQQVAEAFVKLKAYGLDAQDGTLKSVGNAASAMGKGLDQGVEALADAAQGEFERLKEFGIRGE